MTTPGFTNVLYVELQTGQVSFHSSERMMGPDFTKEWDGRKLEGPPRICRWVASLLETQDAGHDGPASAANQVGG
jgi:hypothetical protein